jgi:hypothetical protein
MVPARVLVEGWSTVHHVSVYVPHKHFPVYDNIMFELIIHRTIMFHPIRCHFSFPATVQDKQVKLKVFEEMAECDFNIQIPIELL